MNTPIDVSLVAGRRPELLERTLASFQERLFRFFEIANFRVNLDPFGGNQNNHKRCLGIIRQFFPDALITEPDHPSFGKAVQRLWSELSSEICLHLEDDWIIHEDIRPQDILHLFDQKTKQVTLFNAHKGERLDAKFHYRRTRRFPFLSKSYDLRKPVFTTSPSFIDSGFGRICAELMNPDLDPEKQFYNRLNPELEHFASFYRNRLFMGQVAPNIISDIGREWRNEERLVKLIVNGVSVWQKKN